MNFLLHIAETILIYKLLIVTFEWKSSMNYNVMKMFIMVTILSVLIRITILYAEMKIILKDGNIVNVVVRIPVRVNIFTLSLPVAIIWSGQKLPRHT